MDECKSKVYIKVDEFGRIIGCDGGYSIENIKNIADWILIDEGTGDRYNHCQNGYFKKPIFEENGVPVYKFESGIVVERTQSEIDADIAALPVPEPQPTVEELQAKVVELETALELLVSGATEVKS